MKFKSIPFVLFLATIIGVSFMIVGATSAADDSVIVKIGLKIAPVPLKFKNDFVGKGSYIVNGPGDCNACHTCPNWDPAPNSNPFNSGPPGKVNVAHYLAGGRVFGPNVISDNITPDPTRGNRPNGLTWSQFLQLIRTGQDPREITDPPHYLNVMPWPIFRNMSDLDLYSIYQYLSAIPHAVHGESGQGQTCADPD